MTFKTFTKEQLFFELEKIDINFDSTKSLGLGYNIFGIFDTKGVFTRCGGFHDFAAKWNSLFKDVIEISTTKDSFKSGKLFYIKWKEDVTKHYHIHKEVPVQELITIEEDAPEPDITPAEKKPSRGRRSSK